MSELNDLLPIAARLVRGNCLHKLYDICEGQGTIRVEKLSRLLDEVGDTMRIEAVNIRTIYDSIQGKE